MSRILEILKDAPLKGDLFERVIEDVLIDSRYINVRRQKSGSQFGYDIVGFKNNECYKIECKNLRAESTVNDIAPKLIWHIDDYSIDKFVIASVNGVSNDLYHLLETKSLSFTIEIWASSYLEKLISNSPRALKRLNIKEAEKSVVNELEPLVFRSGDVRLNLSYSRGTPFSYDYLMIDNVLSKAYSEVDFKLTASISNSTTSSIIVKEIIVRTLKYANTENKRIVRQYQPKGIIQPIQFYFSPSKELNAAVNVLDGKYLEVKSTSTEYIEFKLDHNSEAGYYKLVVEIIYDIENTTKSICSQVYNLHKRSEKSNIVSLCTIGRFYNEPLDHLLNLDEETWNNLRREPKHSFQYLGPTLLDIDLDREYGDEWMVKELIGQELTNANGYVSFAISPNQSDRIKYNLGLEITEKLYSNKEVWDSIRNK